MKVNKLFGVKSITNLIYGLLLMLPFVAVLSRTIYVQANPNAKDSYSDYVETKSITARGGSTLYSGQLLTFVRNNVNTLVNGQLFYVLDNQTNIHTALNTGYTFPIDRVNLIYETGRIRIQFFDTHNNQYNEFRQLNEYWSFYIVLKNDITIGDLAYYYNVLVTTNVVGTIDNAFEYSLKTFTEENNVDSIDFFGWFTNLFLNQDNPHNQIYLGFVNWYMNYTLLVSSGYLLFFALLWFINYVRKILEKSSYHDFGGF